MSGNFGIRTDLAVESKEKYEKNNVEIKGVAIQEKYEEALDLNTTVVRIQTEQGAKAMEKPKGTYITMEAPNLIVPDEDYHRDFSGTCAPSERTSSSGEREIHSGGGTWQPGDHTGCTGTTGDSESEDHQTHY